MADHTRPKRFQGSGKYGPEAVKKKTDLRTLDDWSPVLDFNFSSIDARMMTDIRSQMCRAFEGGGILDLTGVPPLEAVRMAVQRGWNIELYNEFGSGVTRVTLDDGTSEWNMIFTREDSRHLQEILVGNHRRNAPQMVQYTVPSDPRTQAEKPYDDKMFEGEPINNSPQEETIMGFGNKKRALPEDVRQLDFNELRGDQARLLSDFMGVRKGMHRAFESGGKVEGRKFLKEACARDWDRAQQGYVTIVLGKVDAGMKKEMSENDVVKSLYSTVAEIINEHKDDIGDLAAKRVGEALKIAEKGLIEFAKDAIDRAAERKAPIVIKSEGKVKKIKGVLPPEFERMVQLASARIPIMLVGPAGCGKTFLCEKLAEALDMEYSDQSCSEGMSESVFNGLLLPIGKGGSFEHVPSPFIERYENGGVMLLDEIDAGDPNLFTYINKAIANSAYTVPQRWTKPVVKKSRDFVLVAAANTFGHGADAMYVGRNQLDAATLDRFKVGLIQMDYNRDVELSLGSQELCDWSWKVREKIRANKLRRVMSTRVIENLSKMTERYKWGVKEWEAAYFTGWSEADRRLVA